MAFENNVLSDVWDSPDESVNMCVPVSMFLYSSGEIHIVVIDLTQEDEHERLAERRIRFSAQAAAQLIDAIRGPVKTTHLLFGDERPPAATLH